jgi:hypothetical protein
MITIIRGYGCQAIPLVAGFNWAYDLTDVATNPINKEGIGYVSHPYPMKRNKPWEDQWTKDWGFVADKYPLILTEIGFCGPDDRGAHVPVISDESFKDVLQNTRPKMGFLMLFGYLIRSGRPQCSMIGNFRQQGKESILRRLCR